MDYDTYRKLKRKHKTAFTKTKNKLCLSMDKGNSAVSVRVLFGELADVFDSVQSVIQNFEEYCANEGHFEKAQKLAIELETIEQQFTGVETLVNRYSLEASKNGKSHFSSTPVGNALGLDTDRTALSISTIKKYIEKEKAETLAIIEELSASLGYGVGLKEAPSRHSKKTASVKGEDSATASNAAVIVGLTSEQTRPAEKPTLTNVCASTEHMSRRESSNEIVAGAQRDTSQAKTANQCTSSAPSCDLDANALEFTPCSAADPKYKRPVSQHKPLYTAPVVNSTDAAPIPFDPTRHLSRVQVPKFSGDKRNYESWKAAFMSCVDVARCTPEYKLLRLRESLTGDALRVIEGLGHSAAAYEVAKERLERKYGGTRRLITIRLDEVDRFKAVRDGSPSDLERFAELLDVLTVNLYDSGMEQEMGNGALYLTLQKKLSTNLLVRYQRWVTERSLQDSVHTLREFVNEESQFQIAANETINGITSSSNNVRTHLTTTETPQKVQKSSTCSLCEKQHGLWNCEIFKSMSTSERWEEAKKRHACYRCLGQNHPGRLCQKSRTCGIDGCRSSHHRLLHEQKAAANESKAPYDIKEPSGEKPPVTERTLTTTTDDEEPRFIALRTVPVILKGNAGRTVEVNALLDDASSATYINEDVAAELGLHGSEESIVVNVLNNKKQTLQTQLVEFEISSKNGEVSKTATAYTTAKVTGSMPVIDWNEYKQKWPHLQTINFPKSSSRPVVDILIGVDHADLIYSIRDIRGEAGEPTARLTPLGWTCVGKPGINVDCQTGTTLFTFYQHEEEKKLASLLRQYWDIEPIAEPLQNTISDGKTKASIQHDGTRYSVSIPWKSAQGDLPDNHVMAKRRLENTEKRLNKDPEVSAAYKEVIKKYEEKQYIRKVPKTEPPPQSVWYLPHFPVLRPDKTTTKTRLVFDASAKFQGKSLNDVIHQGPKLINDLPAVLLRFRKHPVALMCDIQEMYLQIEMKPEDRPYHRFLWRDMQEREPDVYEFNRLVFGVNSSPYLAQFVSRCHAEKHRESFPLAAETILRSTYMDDSMDSMIDPETGIELYEQLSTLWGLAGMHARKWLSNSKDVLRKIPAAECASDVNLDRGELPSTKTLGVTWSPAEDMFTFSSNQPNIEGALTKRKYLQGIATLFDPLGFLSPYTMTAKVLLQEMWTSGADWDGPLDQELSVKAKKWFDELNDLPQVKIPRCLRTEPEGIHTLHAFSDASQNAYGAVVYSRFQTLTGDVICRIISSKSKVAPLTAVSIPRLELMAAVVAVRLAQDVTNALDVDMSTCTFWSDSMDVLHWVRSQSRTFKPFVAHRIGEIQRLTNPQQWRYVPTKENPADLLSRGLKAKELAGGSKWWNGPAFLKSDPVEWPENKLERKPDCKEVKQQFRGLQLPVGATFTTMQLQPLKEEFRLNPARFSSFTRLIRVFSWVKRFVDNCRLSKDQRQNGKPQLSTDEIRDAEMTYIQLAQVECFNVEIKALRGRKDLPNGSALLPLRPTLDEDGTLRCDGRLQYAEFLPFETRHPIILPRHHAVTKLIVRRSHEKLKHGGTNHVFADLSARFWIIAGREAIREVEKSCAHCSRIKAKPKTPTMAPLPSIRLQNTMRAFTETSIDYAGPFITKQGRGKSRNKRYLCLFTCLATRAVHLEMAYSLETDSFLNAFFRMTSRRGMPSDVLTDNGSNFVGGKNELDDLQILDQNRIEEATSSYGVRWHFNPPLAPHFSGVHEVMIKAAKRAIYAILGNADITDEELQSAIIGAEGLINSRPLTYQATNPDDLVPLTPNHFLHGQMGGQFAPEAVDSTDFNPRKRWRRVQELVRHFWHRWLTEWLPSLNKRKKWHKDSNTLKVGDVVLVVSADLPRGKWPLGRVTETFPGKDGRVRVVNVRVGKTMLRRSVSMLCLLKVYDD